MAAPGEVFMSCARLLILIVLALLFFALLNIAYPAYLLNQMSYDAQRIIELIFLGIITVWLLIDYKFRLGWLNQYHALPLPARLGLLIFFGIGLASALLSHMPRFAFLDVSLDFFLLVALFTIAAFRKEYGEKWDHSVVWVLMISMGVYELYLLYADITYWYFNNNALGETFLLSPGFQNIRFFMSFLSIIWPLMVLPSLWYREHPRWARILYFLISALCWYAMILNHARTLYLEWVVIPLILWCWFRPLAKPWLTQQLKAAFVGFLLYKMLSLHASYVPTVHDDTIRLQLWWSCIQMALHHPLLGVGPMHFAYYFKPAPWVAHPHSIFFLILAEWGIPAVIIFVVLVVLALVAWFKMRKIVNNTGPQTQLYVAFTASVLAGGIDSLLNGTTVIAISQLSIIIVAGWMMGWYGAHRPLSPARVTRKAHGGLVLLLLGMAAVLLYGLFPLILELPQVIQNYVNVVCVQQQDACVLAPHFWAEGYIQFYVIR